MSEGVAASIDDLVRLLDGGDAVEMNLSNAVEDLRDVLAAALLTTPAARKAYARIRVVRERAEKERARNLNESYYRQMGKPLPETELPLTILRDIQNYLETLTPETFNWEEYTAATQRLPVPRKPAPEAKFSNAVYLREELAWVGDAILEESERTYYPVGDVDPTPAPKRAKKE